MKVKPDLSFWKLWNISFGFWRANRICFAKRKYQPHFSTLGADPHSLSYFGYYRRWQAS